MLHESRGFYYFDFTCILPHVNDVKIIFLLSLGELGIIDIARFINDTFLSNTGGLNFNKLVRDDFLFNKVILSICLYLWNIKLALPLASRNQIPLVISTVALRGSASCHHLSLGTRQLPRRLPACLLFIPTSSFPPCSHMPARRTLDNYKSDYAPLCSEHVMVFHLT